MLINVLEACFDWNSTLFTHSDFGVMSSLKDFVQQRCNSCLLFDPILFEVLMHVF